MASNPSSKQKRTEEYERDLATAEQPPSRKPSSTASAQGPAAPSFDSDDEAAAGAAQQTAIVEQQALAERNVRMARTPGAMGPLGRNLLLIGALALAALVGIWALLVL